MCSSVSMEEYKEAEVHYMDVWRIITPLGLLVLVALTTLYLGAASSVSGFPHHRYQKVCMTRLRLNESAGFQKKQPPFTNI